MFKSAARIHLEELIRFALERKINTSPAIRKDVIDAILHDLTTAENAWALQEYLDERTLNELPDAR